MKILYSQIIELPVHTENDDYLGKVFDTEIDLESYGLLNIHVKSKNPLRGLFEGVLIIGLSQIIKITAEKIIVDNSVKKNKIIKDIEISLPNKEKKMLTTSARSK